MMQTPLEIIGGNVGTPWQDGVDFLYALAADSPRVRVEVVGQTVGGKDIHLVAIGYPFAPPASGSVRSSSAMVTAFQHGPERAGREGALHFIRDMVYTSDPADLLYLNQHPIYVMPTINGDRAPYGIRQNLNNIDLNRDHLLLSQPETRAMEEAIRRVRPEIVVDLHENDPFPNDAQLVGVTQWQATETVRTLSDDLYLSVANYIAGDGYTYEHFSAGTDSPNIFRNAVGLRHSLAMVMETDGSAGTLQRRLAIHVSVVRGVLAYHGANAAAVRSGIHTSRQDAISRGLSGVAFKVNNTATLNPAPLGYRLDATQYAAVSGHLAAFHIQAIPDGATWIVPMGQPAYPLIPFIMDTTGYPDRTTQGTRVYDPALIPAYVEPAEPPTYVPAPFPIPEPEIDYGPGGEVGHWGPIRVAGNVFEVATVSVQAGGALQTIWASP